MAYPPELIVRQFVALAITGNIAHANIDLRIPKFMHRLLVTPQFHRIHHSADAKEDNSNFGVMLPIWDMIFGTHVDPVTTKVREGHRGRPATALLARGALVARAPLRSGPKTE